jgi:hypothetical protein
MIATPEIGSYAFGRIVVDGAPYLRDLIIYPDRVDAGWRREESHSLAMGDLAGVIAARPEVLVVGRGAFRRMQVPSDTRKALRDAGIELIVEATRPACATYNRLRTARRVVAALHLSC